MTCVHIIPPGLTDESRRSADIDTIIYFVVSLLASISGAICGIGGGVIIKPVLDLLRTDSVATISFLSSCTVLAMSCYSVLKNLSNGENRIDLQITIPLAVGGAVGGVVGKQSYSSIAAMYILTLIPLALGRPLYWRLLPSAPWCTHCARKE